MRLANEQGGLKSVHFLHIDKTAVSLDVSKDGNFTVIGDSIIMMTLDTGVSG